MKKLIIVCGSTNIGGAELQLVQLIQQLSLQSEVKLVLIGKQGKLLEYLTQAQVTYERFEFAKLSWFKDFISLTSLFRKYKADTCLGWLYRGEILGAIAAKLAGVKHIVGSSRNTLWPGATKLKIIALKVVRKNLISLAISNSKVAEEWHTHNGLAPRECIIIPNFVRDEYRNTYAARDFRQTPVVLGLASRAVSGKGHSVMVEACAILVSRGCDVRFDFIGFGIPDWNKLLEKIKNLGIEKHVNLRPGKKHLAEWYSTIDLYVLASDQWESDSNALMEAVLCGVPAVVSKSTETSEYSPGFLSFLTGDSNSLAVQIEAFLQMTPEQINQESKLRRQNLLSKRDTLALTELWIQTLRLRS